MQMRDGNAAKMMATRCVLSRKHFGPRSGAAGLVFAMLAGLSVCAAGGSIASAAVPSGVHVVSEHASSAQPQLGSTHTVWQGGEATVTGSIAPGTQLRVHAVLNPACKVGHFTTATCLPQSLLGWEKISEDGTFSPVPAPVAPYGVCQGDTVVIGQGHTRVISGQLFQCFTLATP